MSFFYAAKITIIVSIIIRCLYHIPTTDLPTLTKIDILLSIWNNRKLKLLLQFPTSVVNLNDKSSL